MGSGTKLQDFSGPFDLSRNSKDEFGHAKAITQILGCFFIAIDS
jgi:hypothetical protein